MKTFKQFLIEQDAYHPSLYVQPGKHFTYIRSTSSAKKNFKNIPKERFAQHIEPAGRYMQATSPEFTKNLADNMETGTHKFDNPLYIHWGKGGYQNTDIRLLHNLAKIMKYYIIK